MSSSTAGDRRWNSAKRGGMTVLGKVAVPKPINLPSQRLENNGLDPSVEIVPKGSLSWGARSSSSGLNAWGSSSVLSTQDGGNASPTRPSTAGSERILDSTSNAWAPNSRPSSASGMLASNNASSIGLRPQSAETRPGSSHLSRFAEPSADGPATWGSSGSADKLGKEATSNNGFSLSSGDFPTLGSEKDSGKDVECLDHNDNGPSLTTDKMDTPLGDANSGMVNSWKNDGNQHVAHSPHPGMERWHGDQHPYPNTNIPPHPYENWQGGAPANSPAVGWFRGPPGASYGAPPMASPGGFPMDPFQYYRPQVPAPGLGNSHGVHPHITGPHSENGDFGRPIMDACMRPSMPIRPGFYPGYYGPPMGFCNPNDRDSPFMGMTSGPPIYNRYPNQNPPEPTNLNARYCEGRTLEQVDCGPPGDSQRYHNVPVKKIMGWDKNVEEDKSHPGDKGYAANAFSRKKLWSEDQDHGKDEQMNYGKFPSQSRDKIGSMESSSVKFNENISCQESTNANPVIVGDDPLRSHTSFQKIERTKLCASDRTRDICREDPQPYSRQQAINSKASHPILKANTGAHMELKRHNPSGILVPMSREMANPAEDKGSGSTIGSGTTISRNFSHHLQGRGEYDGRGRFKIQRNVASESPGVVAVSSERTTNVQGQEQHPSILSTVTSWSDGEAKDDATLYSSDSCDSQRAKMREIAKQRAIQLQKEEEERIKEQKAKALAKLEELNKRSANQGKEIASHKTDNGPKALAKLEELNKRSANQGKEISSLKTDNSPQADALLKGKESEVKIELHFGSYRSEVKVSTSQGCIASKASNLFETDKSSAVKFSRTNQQLHLDDAALSQKKSLPATDDVHINDVADSQNFQLTEISRQKRAVYKQKNIHSTKSISEKPLLEAKGNSGPGAALVKEIDGNNVSSISQSSFPADSLTIFDSLVHPKKKNNRAGKNKHKVDESFAVSLPSVQKASESGNESMQLKTDDSNLEPFHPPVDLKDDGQLLNINPSLPHDDALHRGNSSQKPQHARKLPKNSRGRLVEKSYNNDAVVWAPVRSHNKTEVKDIVAPKTDTAIPSTRIDNSVPSSSKSKRAEMERYVPKPAMRDQAQQGSIQLSASSSTEQSIPDGMISKWQASSQIIEKSKTLSEVESKSNQMHTPASRNQRESTESNFVQISVDVSSSMMKSTKNSHPSDEQNKAEKTKELPKGSTAKPVPVKAANHDEWPAKQPLPSEVNEEGDFNDGWNIVDEPAPAVIFSGAKDHGTSVRGKRNSFKGHKATGNPHSFGSKYHKVAEVDADYYSETTQTDRPTSSKGKNIGQWQPKSQMYVSNQSGNMGSGTVTSESDKIYKGETSGIDGSEHKQHHQGASQGVVLRQSSSVLENKGNSRMKDPVIKVELGPVGRSDSTNIEQCPSSYGHRRNGNCNGRSKGQEFHGDPRFIIRDNKPNYTPANREKQGHNSRYEYQPVQHNSTNRRATNPEGQIDNQHAGLESRDQHPGSHMRRGGGRFYGRHRGNNQSDAGYE